MKICLYSGKAKQMSLQIDDFFFDKIQYSHFADLFIHLEEVAPSLPLLYLPCFSR